MEQTNWRGMRYYDVLWRERHLTLRELRTTYSNYYTYVFWSMIVALLVLFDLHGFAARVSIAALLTYTILMVVVTVSIYILVTLIGIKISKTHPGFFIVLPIVGLAAMTISTYAVELAVSSVFSGGMSVEYAAEKLPVNLILGVVFETLYITFVLPVAISSLTLEKSAMPDIKTAECTSLTIAGKNFLCADLVSVSSQDHYVLVRTHAGETMMRARLSDLIGQLNCRNGIQPHRSHWVTRDAVAEMVSQEGHKLLKMKDGSHIPIARGRVADVRRWLET